MNKSYQPHEAHIPYLLQLFIDYNLYGMNLINLAAVKFRKARRKSKDFFLTTKQLFWGLKITIFLTLWSNGYYILFPFRLYSVSKLNLCIAFHRFPFCALVLGKSLSCENGIPCVKKQILSALCFWPFFTRYSHRFSS